MIEKFLVQSCSRDAFKDACLKYHCKFDSLWLRDVLFCPSYAYGLLKHICMLSGVKFEKV